MGMNVSDFQEMCEREEARKRALAVRDDARNKLEHLERDLKIGRITAGQAIALAFTAGAEMQRELGR